MDFEPRIALTTVASEEEAARLATALVERKLAACVNIVSGVASVYRWEGKIQNDKEFLLVIKTSEEKWPGLQEAFLKLHPYEVPETVLLQPGDVGAGYLGWWRESLSFD